MNERIKELAKQQAGAILMDLIMPDSGMPERVKWNVGITSEHMEKFAELIVQECMDVVAKKCASPTAYQALAEHWGVDDVAP